MISQEQIDALVATLLANAAGPASASNDTGSVTQRSVTELIEAVRFIASMKGANNATRGLRMNALRPAGSVFGHGEIAAISADEYFYRRFV
jgi:hypothetical protein